MADKLKGLFGDAFKKLKTDSVKEHPREAEMQEDFTLEEKEKAGEIEYGYACR